MNKIKIYDFQEYKIAQIPVMVDNYIYVISHGQQAFVVDPALAEPVNEYLASHRLNLLAILNTHHHPDHVGGNAELVEKWNCEVFASDYDRERIPFIRTRLNDRDQFKILDAKVQVIYIPGHTLGHIAYYFRDQNWLFSGDTIFSLGCGRLFEGTPQQMHNSLSKLKALDEQTLIFCTHEYTASNLAFHLSIYPNDPNIVDRKSQIEKLRAVDEPTVPTTLALEKHTNLFLRWNDSGLRQALQMPDDEDWQVFARLRQAKDQF